MDEYTASNFGGAMQGDLLAAAFNGNIYRMELNAAGDDVINGANGEALLSGFGATPLDLVAQGDTPALPGRDHRRDLRRRQHHGVRARRLRWSARARTTRSLDEDTDGYDNADEIDNGTNPCSGGSKPDDADGDLRAI